MSTVRHLVVDTRAWEVASGSVPPPSRTSSGRARVSAMRVPRSTWRWGCRAEVHFRTLSCVLCCLSLAACGDSPAEPDPDAIIVIHAPASTEIIVGDELSLTTSSFADAALLSWASRDTSVAGVTAGLVEARRPGTVQVDVTALGASGSLELRVLPRDGGYAATEIDYFAEIAFGAEFGNLEPLVRRWATGPTIRVNGSPTDEDRATLEQVVAELNALMTTTQISLVESDPTVELHFAPTAQFPDILPQYIQGNIGFFWVWFDARQVLNRSVVLIANDVDAEVRRHLIREEVTQMLGLMQDSFTFPESIFYQAFSRVSEYASVDRAVIEMLYGPHVMPGMERLTAVRGLRRATRIATGPLAAPSSMPEVRGRPGSGGGATVAAGGL